MSNLAIQEIKSYTHCSSYYNFRWVENLPLFRVKARTYWFDALRSCAIDFFKTWSTFEHMPSIEDLQALWQKAWYTDPLALDWKTTARNEGKQSMGADGWLVLTNLYRWAESRPIIIGGVSFPYGIPFKDITVSGTIDLLLYTDASRVNFEAIKFVKSTYEATKMVGHNDIELTAWRYTLKQLTDLKSKQEPVLRYYVLDNVQNPFILTHRNSNQEEILEETVQAVADGIKNSSYYPHYGNRCLACDYKEKCNKGNYKEEE